MPVRTLNHFACCRFADAYWALDEDERRRVGERWLAGLRAAVGARTPAVAAGLSAKPGRSEPADRAQALDEGSGRTTLYQVYPIRGEWDVVVWSAVPVPEEAPEESAAAPARFFERFARATAAARPYLASGQTFWGLTRPSPYTARPTSGRSTAIDPLEPRTARYLVFYPFVKTADWYLLGAEERRAAMGEHIRVGRTYPDVDQLLLYSFGLGDQEFVVVYETADLGRFSELVHELRATEARRWTARDTPTVAAVRRPDDDPLGLWR